jgi:hypothetical protein
MVSGMSLACIMWAWRKVRCSLLLVGTAVLLHFTLEGYVTIGILILYPSYSQRSSILNPRLLPPPLGALCVCAHFIILWHLLNIHI